MTKVAKPSKRHYQIEGYGDVNRVTSVLSVIGKPALINWAASEERKLALHCAGIAYEQHNGNGLNPTAFASKVGELMGAEKAHKKVSDKALNIGSQTHHMVEWLTREMVGIEPGEKPEISPPAQRAVDMWVEWTKKVDFKPLAIENTVYDCSHKDRRLWYAGTMDALALVNGVLTVVDYKTGAGIYWEAQLQNAAYRHAIDVSETRTVDGVYYEKTQAGLIILLPKRPDIKFQVKELPEDYTRDLGVFRAAQMLYAGHLEHEEARRQRKKAA